MIELTPEQRRQIYEEEKARLKASSDDFVILLISNVVAILALAGLISLAKYDIQPKIKDLREAQTGVYTEE